MGGETHDVSDFLDGNLFTPCFGRYVDNIGAKALAAYFQERKTSTPRIRDLIVLGRRNLSKIRWFGKARARTVAFWLSERGFVLPE
ncbi:MAG: hypothetical protein WDN10_00445 [bacterium]